MSKPLPTGAAAEDQTGRFVVQPNGRPRPLSPHLQVWRWHVTMLGSILHRVTGSALVGGVILVALWLGALAFGPEAYATFVALAGSPLGLLVWIGLSLAAFYHLAAGVRHLIWDTGAGLTPRAANLLSSLSIAFAVVATIALWVALFVTGKVAL
ncbi:succinate dehydrogenase, cytochrome b556 subunit [Brevundimonas sp.]|uniref:succinate dehydrogenase, cytochrome b556 subunit n=1 Tax=Brevundimonas sp. TaxID=1871086 RepID=UPI00262C975D|nr:succinate dehydrogenase, cytochrome b556 subunit [Brevundimonas sp.]